MNTQTNSFHIRLHFIKVMPQDFAGRRIHFSPCDTPCQIFAGLQIFVWGEDQSYRIAGPKT
jgi:hypothetical protein